MRHIREIAEALSEIDTVTARAEDIETLFGEPTIELHRLFDQIVEAIKDRNDEIADADESFDRLQGDYEELDELRDSLDKQKENLRRALGKIKQFASGALRVDE